MDDSRSRSLSSLRVNRSWHELSTSCVVTYSQYIHCVRKDERIVLNLADAKLELYTVRGVNWTLNDKNWSAWKNPAWRSQSFRMPRPVIVLCAKALASKSFSGAVEIAISANWWDHENMIGLRSTMQHYITRVDDYIVAYLCHEWRHNSLPLEHILWCHILPYSILSSDQTQGSQWTNPLALTINYTTHLHLLCTSPFTTILNRMIHAFWDIKIKLITFLIAIPTFCRLSHLWGCESASFMAARFSATPNNEPFSYSLTQWVLKLAPLHQHYAADINCDLITLTLGHLSWPPRHDLIPFCDMQHLHER